MSAPVRVAVIGGGQNGEHDVSLASARAITLALSSSATYVPVCLTITRDGTWVDERGCELSLGAVADALASCDVAFPAVHGARGEDGALATLCEWIGVPYVGSSPRAGAVGMDKWLTKLVANAVGVATAPASLVTRSSRTVLAWDGPVVVKPVSAGSSIGVSLVEEPSALASAIDLALEFDDRALVEKRIIGREVDVAVVEDRHGGRYVSPCLEITTQEGIFDNRSKYDGSARFVVPAPLGPGVRERIEQAAVTVFDALGCAGVARVDFFVTASDVILNEVNTMPGMTPASQLPRMLAAGGLDYFQVVDMMIRAAVNKRPGTVSAARRQPTGVA